MPAPEFVLAFETLGVRAEVATDDATLRDRLPEVLPPGARAWEAPDTAPAGPRFRLVAHRAPEGDAEVSVERVGIRAALIDLAGLVEGHLAQNAPHHVFVHAGAVAVGDTGIVIPGHTLTGKTTLVAELVRAGATLYSDEYAVLDGDGVLHPYARPLSLRHDPRSGNPEPPRWRDLPGRIRGHVPVAVPAERVGRRPIRVGWIIVTRHLPGAEWRPAEADRGEGALTLIEHTVAARRRLGAVLRAVSRSSSDARVLVGPRGEAAQTAQAMLARVGLDGTPRTTA